MKKILISALWLILLASTPTYLPALAEGILFSPKAMGRAGAVSADPIDAFVGAYNPATMAFVGDRFDLGLTLHMPRGTSCIKDNLFCCNKSYDNQEDPFFILPDFAIHRGLCDCHFGYGLLIYTRRHFTTKYDSPIYLLGDSNLKFEYLNEVFSAVCTYRFDQHHAAGISADLMVARLKAKGLELFDDAFFSLFPGRVTNEGHDYSYGIGFTIGWFSKISDCVRFGISWQPEIHMSGFDKYKGLLNRKGKWHLPQRVIGGISVDPWPQITVEVDMEYIQWNAISQLNNPFIIPGDEGEASKLGGKHGPGFGWRDHTIFSIGGEWHITDEWTARMGYRRAHTPIKRSQTFFNLLLADVNEELFTFGGSWQVDGCNEISAYYGYGLSHTVRGKESIPFAFGGGEVNLTTRRHLLGLSWGRYY